MFTFVDNIHIIQWINFLLKKEKLVLLFPNAFVLDLSINKKYGDNIIAD